MKRFQRKKKEKTSFTGMKRIGRVCILMNAERKRDRSLLLLMIQRIKVLLLVFICFVARERRKKERKTHQRTHAGRMRADACMHRSPDLAREKESSIAGRFSQAGRDREMYQEGNTRLLSLF